MNYPLENGQFRIIECRAKKGKKLRYDLKEQKIMLFGPNYESYINLTFNSGDLFKEIRNKMYSNSSSLFVVAGIWEKGDNDNSYACDIVNKEQVHIK